MIGALWNRIDRTISFFKNGVSLGVAFSDVPEDRLYPTVGLRTTNEEVSRSVCHVEAVQRLQKASIPVRHLNRVFTMHRCAPTLAQTRL